MSYLKRILPIIPTLKHKSVMLLGPRRSGKSSLLRNQLVPDQYLDLLKADVFQRLSFNPAALRESLKPSDRLVVIDEAQKLPALLDEVHAMIEETKCRFVITGSSARRLKRSHTALMAGRTRRLQLRPFCYPEIEKQFKLERYLLLGGMPSIYLAEDEKEAHRELRDYAGDYLREEILAEALVRKVDSFSRFLHVAARMNGELLNFEAIGSDAQVPARTVREYFSVLEDTLVGNLLEPLRFKGKNSRKAIATAKFYLFDCGVINSLVGREQVSAKTPEFGNLFETWIFHELLSFGFYRSEALKLNFWRSPTGQEVDFVINEEIAIEVKASAHIGSQHTKGLKDLAEIHKLKRKIIVCFEKQERKVDGIEIMPWQHFVQGLWSGDIV